MTRWVDDLEQATLENETFRTVLWTGAHMQITVMRLAPGEEIGVEMHDDTDQFIRIEQGQARVEMGEAKDALDDVREAGENFGIAIPGGTWHNVVNAGDGDLKLYSVYTPPEHPPDTVHRTKAEADAAEAEHHRH